MQDDERMTGRDELDGRIDAALRSYAEPGETTEPRLAVARIVERARVQRPQRLARSWVWGALAASCGVGIAVLISVWMLRTKPSAQIAWTPRPPAVVLPVHPAPMAVTGSAVRMPRPATASAHRQLATARPLPKLDVFPTPTPLTPQEQALVAFAQHGPTEVQHAVLEDQKHWDDPIIVADLQEQPRQPATPPNRQQK